MNQLTPIYNSTIDCPVCEKNIEVTKVRSKFVKLVKQDEDFCPHYELWNPILYEAWICSHCGYAAHNTVFQDITFHDQKIVLEKISKRWTSRDFTGERNEDQALEAFKIVLYNLQVRGAPPSEFGKVCLRIAWIYRYKGNLEDEYKFLRFSFDYYKKAYTNEHLNKGRLDEYTCMYIIAELGRRLDLMDESMLWFGKLISASANPKDKEKIPPVLLDNAREQVYKLRHS